MDGEFRLASLPTELLMYIASYIPQRPRLLVLSILFKRFREICLWSITHLPEMSDERIKAALRILPNVTSMYWDLHSPTTGASWPTSSLRQLAFISTAPPVAAIASLSLLTSLVMWNAGSATEQILAALPVSMKTLAIRECKIISLQRFLNLTDLTLNLTPTTPASDIEILTHLPLTALKILAEVPVSLLPYRFTSVVHLNLAMCDATEFEKFFPSFPALRSIDVPISGRTCVNVLRQHTHLTFLIADQREAAEDDLQCFPKLFAMDTPHTPSHLTTLARLVLLDDEKSEWQGFDIPMPRLRVLEIPFFQPRRLDRILRNCPALRRLTMKYTDGPEVLPAVLDMLQHHGIESVDLQVTSARKRKELLVWANKLLWLRVAVLKYG